MSARDVVYALKGDGQLVTEMRVNDGYINATKLCKSADKLFNDYYRNKRTQAFLAELSLTTGKSVKEFVESEVGGAHTGTWVHPDVAINLATWCSPKFAVAVANLVRRYFNGEITTEESRTARSLLETEVLVTDYDKQSVLYLGEVDTPEFKGVKAGSTKDLVRRDSQHKKDFGSFRLFKVFSTPSFEEAEKRLLSECRALRIRRKCKINGKVQTELVELSDAFTKNDLIILVDKIVKAVERTTTQQVRADDIVVEQKAQDIRRLQLELELLAKLRESEKERMDKHSQQIRELEAKLQVMHEATAKPVEQPKTTVDTNSGATSATSVDTQPNSIQSPAAEFDEYIARHCDFGEDGKRERFRVTSEDLYEHYRQHVRIALSLRDFNAYMLEKFKGRITLKPCTWYHQTHQTFFDIRLKCHVDKKQSLVDKLIQDFVNSKCVVDAGVSEDTKALYDAFEKHSEGKGYDTIKQNGFTRQLFKTRLMKMYGSVSYKEWASPLDPGKKHAYVGIKLRTSPVLIGEAVRTFVDECCFMGFGLRTATIDLWNAFDSFAQTRFETSFTKNRFYAAFREQQPDVVEKHISKSQKGFVGIVLRSAYSHSTQNMDNAVSI